MNEYCRLVSDTMGGQILKQYLDGFEWENHIKDLMQQSNLVPLGKVKCGIHFHRALLFKVVDAFSYHINFFVLLASLRLMNSCFTVMMLDLKVLADRLKVPCSLSRREFNRGFVEVTLMEETVLFSPVPFIYISAD